MDPLVTSGFSFQCDGLDHSDRGVCQWATPELLFISESSAGVYSIVIGDVLSGPDQFYLGIHEGPDGAVLARLCRGFGSDDDDDPEGCATCARAGTIVLNELPDPENLEALHAEIHAEFPGGGTVDATF